MKYKKIIICFALMFLVSMIMIGCGGSGGGGGSSRNTTYNPPTPTNPDDPQPAPTPDPGFTNLPLTSTITHVQPMTGIVVWDDSSLNTSDIQLEFKYVGYNLIVDANGNYNWGAFENILNQIAARKHQAIIRFYDTYPDNPYDSQNRTTVPEFIKKRSDYHETTYNYGGALTYFADWSNQALKDFIINFFKEFAKKYDNDNDKRIAFLEVGFGLWAEYHIDDIPLQLGKNFPDKTFQTEFLNTMASSFKELHWLISIDASDSGRTPFATNSSLKNLKFGLFDDSFLQKYHKSENETWWNFFDKDNRYKTSPAGGELAYNDNNTQVSLSNPPCGESFESMVSRFHISYMSGDGQPSNVIKSAGLKMGYKFEVTSFSSSQTQTKITIRNYGVAPIYYDAFVSVNGKRASQSLKGLLPNTAKTFLINTPAGTNPVVKIECDRLVNGQTIEFKANLK